MHANGRYFGLNVFNDLCDWKLGSSNTNRKTCRKRDCQQFRVHFGCDQTCRSKRHASNDGLVLIPDIDKSFKLWASPFAICGNGDDFLIAFR